MSLQELKYNVDIVMCIDATGSMSPIIDEVKNNATRLREKFLDEMKKADKRVENLRIKIIAFRDFGCDAEPFTESKFFKLDEEKTEFIDFVNNITATGGGDEAENSLEALAAALKSDWTKSGTVRRHVTLMYTDAPALALQERKDSEKYPEDMPMDLAELREWWDGQNMENRAKRLIVFAPNVWPWNELEDWEQTFPYYSQAGAGCGENDMETCIRILVNSI